jgi:5'-nucleotidase
MTGADGLTHSTITIYEIGMPSPLILVTNDDGIAAPGIRVLAESLAEVAEVVVYAPESEQSAVGHGISLHRPLRVREVHKGWYAIDGTPTDCVMLAVRSLLGRRPNIVFSGINSGPNLGDDVTYSGTVAGAFEGMLLGVPSVAISSASYETKDYTTAGRVAALLARDILARGVPPDTVLNVNVPEVPYDELQGISITRQGLRDYEDEIITRKDPRGREYHWIGGMRPSHHAHEGTDFEAVDSNRVSVTPLHRDLTNFRAMAELQDRNITL